VPRNGAGGPRKITSDVGGYNAITVTADSRSLVARRNDSSSNLWVVDVEHPEKAHAITTGVGNNFGTGGVRWRPDGTILFTAFTTGVPMMNVISANGGEIHTLTRGFAAWDPAISPDGQRMAFVSDRSGQQEVWISDLNGGGATEVTHQSQSGSPSWFPDGSLLYMTAGTEQSAWKLAAGSSAPVRLTDRPVNGAKVSPDGQSLLCRMRSTEPGVPLWRTTIYPLDHRQPPRYFEVPRYGGQPMLGWHPDRRGFIFVDYLGGISNLWYQPLDGGEPRQLTKFDSGQIYGGDLSPDGRRFVLSRGERINDVVLIRDFR
jgi:Tol biopolymer transport system component